MKTTTQGEQGKPDIKAKNLSEAKVISLPRENETPKKPVGLNKSSK